MTEQQKTPEELIKEVRDLIVTTQIAEIGGHAFELAKTKLAARAGALADALEQEHAAHAETRARLTAWDALPENIRHAMIFHLHKIEHGDPFDGHRVGARALLAIVRAEVAKP